MTKKDTIISLQLYSKTELAVLVLRVHLTWTGTGGHRASSAKDKYTELQN